MSDIEIVISQWPKFLAGFGTTTLLLVVGTIGAFVVGVGALYLLNTRSKAVRRITIGYIDAMRMLPFLMFIYLLYYGLPALGIRPTAMAASMVGLALYHGAYFAEIMRGAWSQLPAGQTESARACGLYGFRLIRRIILPQLVTRSAPMLGNQLIYLLKDTSFLVIITVQELTWAASAVQSQYFIPFEPFVVAIALYWLLTLIIELGINRMHRVAKEKGLGRA